jgi:hypothetical protein
MQELLDETMVTRWKRVIRPFLPNQVWWCFKNRVGHNLKTFQQSNALMCQMRNNLGQIRNDRIDFR